MSTAGLRAEASRYASTGLHVNREKASARLPRVMLIPLLATVALVALAGGLIGAIVGGAVGRLMCSVADDGRVQRRAWP